ncbi:MAG: DMT family transporter [Alphaproteobacteria bacterium]|nr:MAG: DMT family transporter [Alphaproteobacteria bacterium]
MLATAVLVTIMGALVKYLGQSLPAHEIVAVRAVILVAAILAFMLHQPRCVFRPRRPWLLAGRTATLAIVNVLGFWVLTVLPLAYVTAISFSKPLFITLLAVLFLGEVVRLRRALATLIGFLGVLIMVNPAALGPIGAPPLAALAALAVAAVMAVGVIQVKKLAESDHPNTIILYTNLGVALVTAVPSALFWVSPDGAQWAFLVMLALVGLAAQTSFIRAYRAAEASFVAPFEYVRILTAALAGYLFFDEVPHLATAIGAALIAASTLYIARREARLRRTPLAAAPPDA